MLWCTVCVQGRNSFWLRTEELLVISSRIIYSSLWVWTQWVIQENSKEGRKLRDGCGKLKQRNEDGYDYISLYVCLKF